MNDQSKRGPLISGKLVALGCGATILVPILIVVIVGALQPTEHDLAVSAEIDASAEEVYALITDVESYPEWRTQLEAVDIIEQGESGPTWTENWGEAPDVTLSVVAADPNRSWTTSIEDANGTFTGTWTFELEEADGTTTVTITEHGEVHNVVARFMLYVVTPSSLDHYSTLYLSQLDDALSD